MSKTVAETTSARGLILSHYSVPTQDWSALGEADSMRLAKMLLAGALRRRELIALVVLALTALCVWLERCYSAQVNASISAVKLSARIIGAKKTAPESPVGEEMLDRWGRPFARFEHGDCLVLVSYGSDGVPDRADYGTSLCSAVPQHRSSCWWPTRDTVVVNGVPTSACMK